MILNFSVSKKREIKDLRKELWDAEERIDKLESQLDSMAKVLGVAFSADGCKAFRVIKENDAV